MTLCHCVFSNYFMPASYYTVLYFFDVQLILARILKKFWNYIIIIGSLEVYEVSCLSLHMQTETGQANIFFRCPHDSVQDLEKWNYVIAIGPLEVYEVSSLVLDRQTDAGQANIKRVLFFQNILYSMDFFTFIHI